nr:uncharacterized protein LOC122321594 [Drosophila bipectinata]
MTAHLVVHLILTLLLAELFQLSQATKKNIKPNRQDVKDKKNQRDKNVFKIKPAENTHIQFSYYRQNVKNSTNSKGNKKKEPKYYLNFDFNNYRNPKSSKDRQALSNKVKMRRTRKRLLPNGKPNPYNYFPLKGEDM